PSVVLEAKTEAGYAFDTAVTMDGAVVATKLDGRSIEVDPGVHTFRFTREGASPIEEKVLVHEGDKSLLVSVTWAPPPSSAPAEARGITSPPPLPRMTEPQPVPVAMTRPVPASVWIIAGA